MSGHVDLDRLGRAGHVRALRDDEAAVLDELFGVIAVELVLCRARQSDVALDAPGPLALEVLGALELLDVLADAAALDVLELHDPRELLAVDAVRIVDRSARIGQSDDLGAEVEALLGGVLRDVTGTGNGADLAFERVAFDLEHFLGEVDLAVAGGLGPDQRAAPVPALAGQDAGELVAELLVHPEQEADLTAAHADIAGGNVCVGADVPEELHHEGLAETHDLAIRLALRIEVGATLAAAHGQRGQRVLEDLLEGEELQHAEVDGRMETQAALVGTDCAVHLNAETPVDLDLAIVGNPGNTEHYHALGLGDTLEDLRFFVPGIRLDEGTESVGDFLDSLMEFGLVRIASLDLLHEFSGEIGHSMPPELAVQSRTTPRWGTS